MRLWLAVVAITPWGCSGDERDRDGEPPACPQPEVVSSPVVRAGDYRLEVTYVGGFSGRGPRIAIEADGRFTGRGGGNAFDGNLWMCDGITTTEEADAIADAINQAELFRYSSNPQNCADHAMYDISIAGVAGDIDGLQHTLRYERCMTTCSDFDEFVEAALAPARRATEEGPCIDCPPDLYPGECFGEVGRYVFCEEDTVHRCEFASDIALECRNRALLECDPPDGWVPAASWWIASATLTRRVATNGTRVSLSVELTVDNRSMWPFDLTPFYSLLVFRDDEGVRIDPQWFGDPGSHEEYAFLNLSTYTM